MLYLDSCHKDATRDRFQSYAAVNRRIDESTADWDFVCTSLPYCVSPMPSKLMMWIRLPSPAPHADQGKHRVAMDQVRRIRRLVPLNAVAV